MAAYIAIVGSVFYWFGCFFYGRIWRNPSKKGILQKGCVLYLIGLCLTLVSNIISPLNTEKISEMSAEESWRLVSGITLFVILFFVSSLGSGYYYETYLMREEAKK